MENVVDQTKKRLSGKTIVVAGASSGIGRLTALECARAGANVGLIARSLDGLGTLAKEIADLGAKAFVIPADVADAGAIERAAGEFAREFGGIDVWVNNAAVSVYGEFDQISLEDMRRVMDVNFWGQVHGARAALPYLEQSESGGRLICLLSVDSEIGLPLHSPYIASKHALYGFYKSMHEELLHRGSKVALCTILPASISTPFFEHSKTYLGVRPRPVAPVYSPERVVQAILRQIDQPRFSSVVGGSGKLFIFLERQFQGLAHRILARSAYRQQRSAEPKSVKGPDNLFEPVPGTFKVRGKEPVSKGIEWAETNSALIAVATLGALGAFGAGSVRTRGRLRKAA